MPLTDAEFLDLQKVFTGYFSHWRAGIAHAFDYEREAEAKKSPFPRPGRWPGHPLRSRLGYYPQKKRHRINKAYNMKGPDSRIDTASHAAQIVKAQLRAANVKFEKVLGWGGLAVACLVEATKEDGRRMKVVCKANLDQRNAAVLLGERYSHLEMAGAKHIVQRVVFQSPASQQPRQATADYPTEEFNGLTLAEVKAKKVAKRAEELIAQHAADKERARRRLDARSDLLFIEYMRLGNLNEYMEKLGESSRRLPDGILWQIFQCLFKACVAMAYPRMFWPLGCNPDTMNAPQISERHYGFSNPDSVSPVLVHFDIDALNILVGDFDNKEHNIVPLIKIADLGLAQLVDVNVRNNKQVIWSLRRTGKTEFFSPEQFTEEWDFFSGAPARVGKNGEPTAGNYHWWTNLYQVGHLMWSLITMCHPEQPPTAREYWVEHPDGTETPAWSYGTYLFDLSFEDIDFELRELVVRCMNHEPASRPTMDLLAEKFEQYAARTTPQNEDDKSLQALAKYLWKDPPAASPPVEVQPPTAAQRPRLPWDQPGPALPRPNMTYATIGQANTPWRPQFKPYKAGRPTVVDPAPHHVEYQPYRPPAAQEVEYTPYRPPQTADQPERQDIGANPYEPRRYRPPHTLNQPAPQDIGANPYEPRRYRPPQTPNQPARQDIGANPYEPRRYRPQPKAAETRTGEDEFYQSATQEAQYQAYRPPSSGNAYSPPQSLLVGDPPYSSSLKASGIVPETQAEAQPSGDSDSSTHGLMSRSGWKPSRGSRSGLARKPRWGLRARVAGAPTRGQGQGQVRTEDQDGSLTPRQTTQVQRQGQRAGGLGQRLAGAEGRTRASEESEISSEDSGDLLVFLPEAEKRERRRMRRERKAREREREAAGRDPGYAGWGWRRGFRRW